MAINTKTAKDIHGWDMKLWLWVFLCSAAIFSTIPLARSIQKFTYYTAGREFFTYSVLFIIGTALLTLLYFLFFKFRTKNTSQYIWLFFCGGAYVYFTLLLKGTPEESVHLLEYGLLTFFVFKALNHRIRDRTVYVTSVLMVSFIGMVDEFIQWMMPGRYWDYRDVGINTLAGLLFVLAVSKGIKPATVSGQPGKFSVRMMARLITLNLIFLGLCLSNTPEIVNTYTSKFTGLSWLRSEEPMTEYGYNYYDPEIGVFYSRLSLDELRVNDLSSRSSVNINIPKTPGYKAFSTATDPFLYEFYWHISKRDTNYSKLTMINSSKVKPGNVALKENLLLEKYFGNTLRYTLNRWENETIKEVKENAYLWKGDYVSNTGKLIAFISLKEVWILIVSVLFTVQLMTRKWKKRLEK